VVKTTVFLLLFPAVVLAFLTVPRVALAQPPGSNSTAYVGQNSSGYEVPLFYASLDCPKNPPLGSQGYCTLRVMPFFPNESVLVQFRSYNASEACKCPVRRRYTYQGTLFDGLSKGNMMFFLPFRVDDKATYVEAVVLAYAQVGSYTLSYGKKLLSVMDAGKLPELDVLPRHVDSLGYESVHGVLVVATNVTAVIQGSLVPSPPASVSLEMLEMQIAPAGWINAYPFGVEVRSSAGSRVTIGGKFKVRKYGTLENLNFTLNPAGVSVYSVQRFGVLASGDTVRVYAEVGGLLLLDTYGEDGLRGFLVYETVDGKRGVAPLTLKFGGGGFEDTVKLGSDVGMACAYVGFPSFNRTVLATSCAFGTVAGSVEVTASPSPVYKPKGTSLAGRPVSVTIRVTGGLPEFVDLNGERILSVDVNRALKASGEGVPLLPEDLASGAAKEVNVAGLHLRLASAGVTYGGSVLHYEGEFASDIPDSSLPVNLTLSARARVWTPRGPVDVESSAAVAVLPGESIEPRDLRDLSLALAVLGLFAGVLRSVLLGTITGWRRAEVDWMGFARFLAYFTLALTVVSFLDQLAAPLKDAYVWTVYGIDDRLEFMKELFNGLYSLDAVTLVTGGIVAAGSEAMSATGAGLSVGLVLRGLQTVGFTYVTAGKMLSAFLETLSYFAGATMVGLYIVRELAELFYLSSYPIVALLVISPGLMSLKPTRGAGAYALGLLGTLWVGLPAMLGLTNYVLFRFGLDVSALRQITATMSLPLGINPFAALIRMGYATASSSGLLWVFGYTGGFGQTAIAYVDLMVKASVVPLALYLLDLVVLVAFGTHVAQWLASNARIPDLVSNALFSLIQV